MRKIFLLAVVVVFAGCQTLIIKDNKFKIANETNEIGSIGSTDSNLGKDVFSTYGIPKLSNKIRVEIDIINFNKLIYKSYLKQNPFKLTQTPITYIDSCSPKPEFISIKILDISGYIMELNADPNKGYIDYLKNTGHANIITGIAVVLTQENIEKIKSADTYYLVNNQSNKYMLALHKSNKLIENIDLQKSTSLGYRLGKPCWSSDDRKRWYISDIIYESKECGGATQSKITKKESHINLSDL